MVRQGSGHIVNTASMGGLMAGGLITSYVATKHAVIGLSLALRAEEVLDLNGGAHLMRYPDLDGRVMAAFG